MTSKRMAAQFSRMRDFPTATIGTQQGNLTRDMDDLVAIMNRCTAPLGRSSPTPTRG